MTNMTKGNAVKHILLFAIPLFIGNIFQQIYNMVDTMVAGYTLGDNAIAAIGSVSTIFSLLLSFTFGLNNGFGIEISKQYGSDNIPKLKKAIATMVILNIGIIACITGASLIFLRPIMSLLNIPTVIFEQAYSYIYVIVLGLIMMTFYNMLSALLRAIGNSKTPLYFLMMSSVLNITLDILFVRIIHTGVGGIALATVISQGFSSVLCWFYIQKKYMLMLPLSKDWKPDLNIYKEMLFTGLSMGMMLSVFAIGSIVLSSGINQLGEKIIVAHTAARRIVEMLMQPLGTVAMAFTTFVGQNWGAGERLRIKQTFGKVYILETIWSIMVLGIIFIFGEQLIILISGTQDTYIIKNAYMNLKINSYFFISLGILFPLRSAMQAMEMRIIPIVSSGIELSTKVLFVILVIPRWGYAGASVTEPFSWILCTGFLLSVYYLRRKKLYDIKESNKKYENHNIISKKNESKYS